MELTIGYVRGMNNQSKFVKQCLAAGVDAMRDECLEMATEMEREADSNVEASLVTDREPKRRKDDAPLLGSFTCEVDFDPDSGHIEFHLTSDTDEAKLMALEHGADPHGIDGNPMLYFPAGTSRVPIGSQLIRTGTTKRIPRLDNTSRARVQRGLARDSNRLVKTPHVNHPGNRAYHFMQRAVDRVVEKRLRNARF